MTRKPPSNPRGRPREFNEEQALDAATRVFADKGYEGASLSELARAMGINRVSMYSTFGNKEALFRKAMDRYTQASGNHLAAASPPARHAKRSKISYAPASRCTLTRRDRVPVS